MTHKKSSRSDLGAKPKRSAAAHSDQVVRAGAIAISVNLLLAAFKLFVSLLSGSLAVLSDALHGVVDTLSGIVVVAAEKIKPHVEAKNVVSGHFAKFIARHSHAEIERAGARIIGVIVIAVAAHVFIEAVESIAAPGEIHLSIASLVILSVSVLAKFYLAFYLNKTGRRTGSATLRASGVESFNDCIISFTVLISAFIYVIWRVNLEAPISILVALFILKSGLELLFSRHETVHA